MYDIKPSLADCSARTYVFVGEKESGAMRKSAKIIHEALNGSFLQVLPRMYHGEFSINYADDFASTVRDIVSKRKKPIL